jgi:hypothetical protein
MSYQHQYTDGTPYPLSAGQGGLRRAQLCRARQGAEQPGADRAAAVYQAGACTVPLEDGFAIPQGRGEVHYEAEIAVLIGKPLSQKTFPRGGARRHFSGFAPALDLTLRDLQASSQGKGLSLGNRQKRSMVPACWRLSCRAMRHRTWPTSASA